MALVWASIPGTWSSKTNGVAQSITFVIPKETIRVIRQPLEWEYFEP